MLKVTPIVRIMPDGREICLLRTPGGRREYKRRREEMWERQKGSCGLCGAFVEKVECTFEHTEGRGIGGSKRDDRIWVEKNGKMVAQNMMACGPCNKKKGSKPLGLFKSSQRYEVKRESIASTKEGVPEA